MSDPIRVECDACKRSGVEVFRVRVFEHGCGFAHDDTEERACCVCNGDGWEEVEAEPITLEDLDPRDPDYTRSGIFRDHNCAYCDSGKRPCRQGSPTRCEYPHARND